jgi:hypothetical protein
MVLSSGGQQKVLRQFLRKLMRDPSVVLKSFREAAP